MNRDDELRRWLEQRLDTTSFKLERASTDASFRRYFRVTTGGRTSIVMDAPPERESCEPFVRIAGLMARAGVHVPEVYAHDYQRGFLLLSDLGGSGYLQALNESSAERLFADAIDALVRWQLATTPGALPCYDEALLRREIELFPEWYVRRHRVVALSGAQQAALDQLFAKVLANNLAQPTVYVHRDYMPRNLMVCEPNPGVLDFQDAVLGPISYDILSLFKDAFISWEEKRVLEWTARYWRQAQRAGLPVGPSFEDFYRDFEWMGVQRHLKVLGIFARLKYRDGKDDYLRDAPRFIRYLRSAAARYRELNPLLPLLDHIERGSEAPAAS